MNWFVLAIQYLYFMFWVMTLPYCRYGFPVFTWDNNCLVRYISCSCLCISIGLRHHGILQIFCFTGKLVVLSLVYSFISLCESIECQAVYRLSQLVIPIYPTRDIWIFTSRAVYIEENWWQFVKISHTTEELAHNLPIAHWFHSIWSQWFINC